MNQRVLARRDAGIVGRNTQPGGGGGHAASGCQPGGGAQPGGGSGQPGGGCQTLGMRSILQHAVVSW
jgi:hypothetical protein